MTDIITHLWTELVQARKKVEFADETNNRMEVCGVDTEQDYT